MWITVSVQRQKSRARPVAGSFDMMPSEESVQIPDKGLLDPLANHTMGSKPAFFFEHAHLRSSRKVRAITHPAWMACSLALASKVQRHFQY